MRRDPPACQNGGHPAAARADSDPLYISPVVTARFDSARSLKWYGLTTVGCMALSPIIGGLLVSANEKRELRSSEVFMMTADCLVPIIGGLIMKAAFDAHPEWDAGTGRPRR